MQWVRFRLDCRACSTWTAVAPAQRLSVLIIPLVMGYYVVHASAAVGLYWVASNVISLLQQYVMARRAAAA